MLATMVFAAQSSLCSGKWLSNRPGLTLGAEVFQCSVVLLTIGQPSHCVDLSFLSGVEPSVLATIYPYVLKTLWISVLLGSTDDIPVLCVSKCFCLLVVLVISFSIGICCHGVPYFTNNHLMKLDGMATLIITLKISIIHCWSVNECDPYRALRRDAGLLDGWLFRLQLAGWLSSQLQFLHRCKLWSFVWISPCHQFFSSSVSPAHAERRTK